MDITRVASDTLAVSFIILVLTSGTHLIWTLSKGIQAEVVKYNKMQKMDQDVLALFSKIECFEESLMTIKLKMSDDKNMLEEISANIKSLSEIIVSEEFNEGLKKIINSNKSEEK